MKFDLQWGSSNEIFNVLCCGLLYQEINETERGRKKRKNEDDEADDTEESLGVRKKFKKKNKKI